MSATSDGLTPGQLEAVEHEVGAVLVTGEAGSGRTHALLARFRRLAEGDRAETIFVLTASAAAGDRLRAALQADVERPYDELTVGTPSDLAARLLRREPAAAGVDPFAEPVSAADRLALMLERIDELALGLHDLQGNPAALLAGLIGRFDALKEHGIDAARYAAWAASRAGDDRGRREREVAELFAAHERILHAAGALDRGDLILRAQQLLASSPGVRDALSGRLAHLLIDELDRLTPAERRLVAMLREGATSVAATADAGCSAPWPSRRVDLGHSLRCPRPVLAAARAVRDPGAPSGADPGRDEGALAFWRCANERAQAQGVAADIERLVARDGVAPESVCVLVRSLRRDGQAATVALEERGVAFRTVGAAAFFQRAEVRDVLAWLRLLADPGDASAVVRALARPPVELRSIDLARCTQIARRRKLDMVSALGAATESPQLPPEARERILTFLRLHRGVAGGLETTRPDLFVHRLIERLGLRRQQLFAAQADVVERLVNLARLGELAAAYARRSPQASAREFARYISAVADAGLREEEASVPPDPGAVRVMAMYSAAGLEFDHVYVMGLHAARMPGEPPPGRESVPTELLGAEAEQPDVSYEAGMRGLLHTAMTRARTRLVLAYGAAGEDGERRPSPFVEQARAAIGAQWELREEELFGPAETLHSTFRVLRDELLDSVARTAGRLSEMRLDTDLDVSHAAVRHLELVKLAALLQRPEGQSVAEALPELNARLSRAVSAEQREIFVTSALDEYLLEAERGERRRARVLAARDEPSLEAFLPRRGDGLMLSASDVETYRVCPLRYKFARVFRIPQEPTIHQRFGILVHQVLERFHVGHGGHGLADMLGLLDAGWRRNGFGDSEEERQLRAKATSALTRYHARFLDEESEPVWFERSFAFKLGPHLLRGRVDRVDRLPDGGYELIDYKTGRPKTAAQLREDVQLSLYAVGAREAWELETAGQAYYYVLDDEKVPVRRETTDREWIADTVMEVAEGIQGQGFEPTPSFTACSSCDFRLICPAAER